MGCGEVSWQPHNLLLDCLQLRWGHFGCFTYVVSGEEQGKEMGGPSESNFRELDANFSGCRSVDLLLSWKEHLNVCPIGK